MDKKFLKLMQMFVLMFIAVMFFSCSDSENSDVEPLPEPVPENYNKIFAGQWTNRGTRDGQWVIDENGNVRVLRINHVFVSSSVDITRDSSFVSFDRAFTLDYKPDTQSVTFTEQDSAGTVTLADMLSVEPNLITFAYPATADTCQLKKNGEFCSVAPESISGFYMSAQRYKVHGLLFGPQGIARQFFYYDDVIDYDIADYVYTRGEGNKAHVSYHVKYRLNPEKVKIFAEVDNFKSDVTFDLVGELDLTFLTYVEGSKTSSECYMGEMDGKVTATVTNNVKNTTTVSEVVGRKYFALTRDEE